MSLGAWATSIFSDDSASDVRDEWREAILDGLSPEDATQRLLETFDDYLEEPDTERLFWMALAAAQMETGRLLPDVCDRALAIIDGGGDVDRWREDGDESLARQRARAYSSVWRRSCAARNRSRNACAARSRCPCRSKSATSCAYRRSGRARTGPWSSSSATAKAWLQASSTQSLHRSRGRAAESRSAIGSRACLSYPTPWHQTSRS